MPTNGDLLDYDFTADQLISGDLRQLIEKRGYINIVKSADFKNPFRDFRGHFVRRLN